MASISCPLLLSPLVLPHLVLEFAHRVLQEKKKRSDYKFARKSVTFFALESFWQGFGSAFIFCGSGYRYNFYEMYAGPESAFICSSICKAFEQYMFVLFTYLQPYTKLCLIIQKVQKEFVEHFNDFTILCNPESGSKLTEYGSNADPVSKLWFIEDESAVKFRIQGSNKYK